MARRNTNDGHSFPKGWRKCSLSAVLTPVPKALREVAIRDEQRYRLLTVRLYAKGVVLRAETTGSRIGTKRLYRTEKGDFVFSKIDARNGAWGFVCSDLAGGLVSSDFPILQLRTDVADGEFIYFAMSRSCMWRPLRNLAVGTTNRRRIQVPQLLQTELLLPPLPEQRAIARVLLTVQRAKDATEKVIAACRQLRQSLMQHLFTYGPVPFHQADQVELKESEIGDIPNHWRTEPLRNVAKLVSGGTPSKKRAEFWSGTIPWATPKDMKLPRLWDTQDHISQDGLEDGSRMVGPGSLFLVIRGMILARDLPIAMAMVPMAFNQDMKAILPMPQVDGEYLLSAFVRYKGRLVPEIGTSAHGTRRIGTAAVKDFLLPIPPREEQRGIAEIISAVDGKIASEESRMQALDALFQTLLHNLMTGKVRVHGVDLARSGEAT